jgi:hypothetical protein
MGTIPYTSKIQHIKDLKERNRAFDALSASNKRREIAYDAALLVMQGHVDTSYGFYWDRNFSNKVEHLKSASELQEFLNHPKNLQCAVCQRGLLMISQIRLGNKLEPTRYNLACGEPGILQGFKIGDFEEMESSFENNAFGIIYESNSQEHMLNICCNVIKNGNFQSNDKTDYLTEWGLKVPRLNNFVEL